MADVSPEQVEANRRLWAAAEKLSQHFALRPWIEMARDRGDLRRKVRDNHFDPNEPTKDDCLEAVRDIRAALQSKDQ